MKTLLIILSGVLLVSNEPNKAQFEAITKTNVVKQGIVPVVAKKENSKAKTTKKATKKKTVKKTKKKLVKKAKKKVVKKKTIKKKTKKKNTKKIVRVRYNVGEIQHYMNVLNAEYGWTNDDYVAWLMIVKRESSFNPYAVNKKSKATGLCQALPARKMATHGSDYLSNYKTQLMWCRDYIKNRYGTPSKAWKFWQKHHWF